MKTDEENLANWLSDARAILYFGRAFQIKAAVLVHLISGKGSLGEIARQHNVGRNAITRYAKNARKYYPGISTSNAGTSRPGESDGSVNLTVHKM